MSTGFDLAPTARQEALKEELHAVARNDLRDRAAAAEDDGVDLAAIHVHLDRAGVAPDRLLRHRIDAPHTAIVAVEELAYGDPGIAWAVATSLQVTTIVDAAGSAPQREAIAAALEAPSATASLLLYEDYGRQPTELETRAVRTSAGWEVTGRKASVAHPAGADASVVIARDGDELIGFAARGPRDGAVVTRDDRASGKIAITAVPTGAVALERVVFADDERLEGGLTLHRAVGQARLLLAAVLLGTARASIEFCAGYALNRTAFGKTLSEHQAVSMPIVEHATEIEEVRLLVWDVAARLGELDDVAVIERLTARAVNRASSLGLRATRDGVQLIGVRAITRDLPSERWYRSAAALGAIDFDVLQTPFGLN